MENRFVDTIHIVEIVRRISIKLVIMSIPVDCIKGYVVLIEIRLQGGQMGQIRIKVVGSEVTNK